MLSAPNPFRASLILLTLALSLFGVTLASADEKPALSLAPPAPGQGLDAGYYVDSPHLLGHLEYATSADAIYANQPLEVGGRTAVEGIGAFHLGAAFGLFEIAEVRASLPLILTYDATYLGEELAPSLFGDLRTSGRLGLFEGDDLAFALALALSLPTGDEDAFLGAGRPVISLGGIAEQRFDRLKLRANLNLTPLRQSTDQLSFLGASTIDLALGAQIEVIQRALDLGVDFMGSTPLDDTLHDNDVPVAWSAYARFHTTPGLAFTAGIGSGLNQGIGTPRAQLWFGLRFQPERRFQRDE